MSNLTINGKPGFPHLSTLPSPVILFSLRQHLQMKYGFTYKKSLWFTKKIRTKGRATFTDKSKQIKLIATYKNGLYFLDEKTTKKPAKKQKSNTKWKKTSTALKGITASHVVIDDPEMHQLSKPCIGEFLVIVTDDGFPATKEYIDRVITEVMDFGTLKEAKRIAREIASDYGCTLKNLYKKRGISISIWKWTEERYLQLEIYT